MRGNPQKTLKTIHLVSTVWFMASMGCVLVVALHQAGFKWWVIFSLSGHWGLLVFLLVSLYLFAIFKGVDKGPDMNTEHPLTSTMYYMAFYVCAPLLGGVAGALAMLGERNPAAIVQGVSMGTLGATFLTWVIVDPAAASIEMLTKASREHRSQRLALAKSRKEQENHERERLLAEILGREARNQQQWQQDFQPYAARLAGLLAAQSNDFAHAQREAIGMGVLAWQKGGLSCMRQVRDMTMQLCRQRCETDADVDYICGWWDGIGDWRSTSPR